ncbi:MAG: hypothetical protein ACQEXJ_21715 [Myxococcota bacterium]
MSRSSAARDVRDTHDELESLVEEHTTAERRVLDAPPLDGEALALLGVGRQVHLEQQDATRHELSSREETLREHTSAHLDRLRERHGKNKLYERERRLRRAELERKLQRELDDLTSGRHGRD